MKKLRTIVLWLLAVMALFVVYVGIDWYRFTTNGEFSPTRGAFGNPKMEIWIDVNARLPEPLRLWGCRTLMDRQQQVMGRPGPEPWGCSADFGKLRDTRSQLLVEKYAEQAAFMAVQRGATKEQGQGVLACVKAGMLEGLGSETLAALDKQVTSEGALAVNAAARLPTERCLKAIGK